MAQNEKLYLCLNDFTKHIQSTWQNLQEDEDFCDITLNCDDKLIKSHKFILSSYSPVFKKMLEKSNPHPMIFFRGMKYADLINIMNFIYQGEVDVLKEDVDHFLTVANDLKIRGLSLEDDSNDQSQNKSPTKEKYIIKSSIKSPTKKLENIYNKKIISNENEENKLKSSSKSMDNCNDEQSQKIPEVLNRKIVDFSKHIDNVKWNSKNESYIPSYEISESNEHGKIIENIYVKNIFESEILSQADFTNCTEIENRSFGENNHNVTCDSSKDYSLVNSKDNEFKEDFYCCQKCNANFTTNEDLRNHSEFGHNYQLFSSKESELKKDFYLCDKCNVNFTTNEDLINHSRFGHDDKLFSCDQCDYKAKLNSVLSKHIKVFHENAKFQCEHCDYIARSGASLHSHRKSHHTIDHCCEYCDYRTNCNLKLIKHSKTNHVCDQCDFKTKVSGSLIPHKKTIHENTVYFPCSQCNYKAKLNARLQTHIEAVHSDSQYVCDKCNYKTTTAGNLKRHNKETHKGILFYCDQCEQKYKSRDKLKTHIDIRHKGVRYPCNQCEFRSTQKGNLKRHIIRTHQKIKENSST